MDDWFGKLAANGGNFARVWLSNDFWDVEHERSGVYDEAKLLHAQVFHRCFDAGQKDT
jgi:hypothetical protein